MVQLVAGKNGKGKTTYLLDKVNAQVQTVQGNIVYIDKNSKHMFELNNRVRLINISDFMITGSDEFTGFIAGIISQDHDLQQIYLDSFLKIACLDGKDIMPVIEKLDKLSEQFGVLFVLSISLGEDELPDALKSKVLVAL